MSVVTINVTRSSMISQLAYDSEAKELTVTFNNGGQYKYFDVPANVFDALISNEDSIGKYFSANVKTKFKYEKI